MGRRELDVLIAETAVVHDDAVLGDGTRVWHFAQIRERALLGSEVTVGSHAYVDVDVTVGSRTKIENGAKLYHPAWVGSGVFIGPDAKLINDPYPRAVDGNGQKLTDGQWECRGVTIGDGASIGAGAIVMPGVRIGARAMVGAGAIVTEDVPDDAVAVGSPARVLPDRKAKVL